MCTHPRTAFRPPRGFNNRTWEGGFRKRRLSWSHWRPWPGYSRYPLSIPPSPALSPPRFVDNRVSTTLTHLLSCIRAGRRDGDWTCPNCSAHVYASRVGALSHPSPPHHPGTHKHTCTNMRAHNKGLTCTDALRCKSATGAEQRGQAVAQHPVAALSEITPPAGGLSVTAAFWGPFLAARRGEKATGPAQCAKPTSTPRAWRVSVARPSSPPVLPRCPATAVLLRVGALVSQAGPFPVGRRAVRATGRVRLAGCAP